MMTRLGLILMLALGVACGDDDGRLVDGGTGNPDTGITFDAGPETDSGISLIDSGPGETDAGPTTDSGPACTPRPATAIPAELLPRCEAATLQCLIDCGNNGTCQNDCFTADATPAESGVDCQICASQQQISCGVAMGCEAQYNAVDCCIQANACADQACITTNCGTESMALQTCISGVGAACQPTVQMCFASE